MYCNTETDLRDQLLHSGQSNKNDVRPPLAVHVLTYRLDKACLSCQGEHCVNMQPVAVIPETAQQP